MLFLEIRVPSYLALNVCHVCHRFFDKVATAGHHGKLFCGMLVLPGDVEDAGNYRPMCALPELYKVFATILYLSPRLDKCQPPDQGGFRCSHQTVDHLMVYRMLEQHCPEWGVPLYISAIDVTKAFDRIKHQARSLRVSENFV